MINMDANLSRKMTVSISDICIVFAKNFISKTYFMFILIAKYLLVGKIQN